MSVNPVPEPRPVKGSPAYDLWVAAIDVAIYPPLAHGTTTTHAAKVPWRDIERLRDALESVGIDWRAAKQANDQRRADHMAARFGS